MEHAAEPTYVLVVDEDRALCEEIGEAFYREGWVPLLASSGRDALDLMSAASAPALIVLAFRLPDTDAPTLLAKLRTDARWSCARVVITGGVPGAYAAQYVRVDAFVEKPFEAEALVRVARSVMARSHRASPR